MNANSAYVMILNVIIEKVCKNEEILEKIPKKIKQMSKLAKMMCGLFESLEDFEVLFVSLLFGMFEKFYYQFCQMLKLFPIIHYVSHIFRIFPPKITTIFFSHTLSDGRWYAKSFMIFVIYFPTGMRQSNLQRRQLVEEAELLLFAI